MLLENKVQNKVRNAHNYGSGIYTYTRLSFIYL